MKQRLVEGDGRDCELNDAHQEKQLLLVCRKARRVGESRTRWLRRVECRHEVVVRDDVSNLVSIASYPLPCVDVEDIDVVCAEDEDDLRE